MHVDALYALLFRAIDFYFVLLFVLNKSCRKWEFNGFYYSFYCSIGFDSDADGVGLNEKDELKFTYVVDD